VAQGDLAETQPVAPVGGQPPVTTPATPKAQVPVGDKDKKKNDSQRPTKRPTGEADPVAPAPKPSVDAATGDTVRHLGGVTLIETGNRHKDQQIHRAPDFNPKQFDAVSYLPKARALAKQIYADAYLAEFDVEGVAPGGKTNLQLANLEATYNFLSPANSKRTLPIGIDEDRPCWVYVEVDKAGVTARIVERDECKGPRRPNPKCTLGEVWERAKSRGAPSSGAVADIDYLHDGWFFSINDFSISILDDC
jgi:hypothetical protein